MNVHCTNNRKSKIKKYEIYEIFRYFVIISERTDASLLLVNVLIVSVVIFDVSVVIFVVVRTYRI